MKNKKLIIIIASIVLFLGIAFLIMLNYNLSFHEEIKSHPVKYCYDDFQNAKNPALYIVDLKHKQDYIDYYNKIKNNEKALGNFPLKGLPPGYKVYVLDSVSHDKISQVYIYELKTRPGRFKCWVYNEMLHELP